MPIPLNCMNFTPMLTTSFLTSYTFVPIFFFITSFSIFKSSDLSEIASFIRLGKLNIYIKACKSSVLTAIRRSSRKNFFVLIFKMEFFISSKISSSCSWTTNSIYLMVESMSWWTVVTLCHMSRCLVFSTYKISVNRPIRYYSMFSLSFPIVSITYRLNLVQLSFTRPKSYCSSISNCACQKASLTSSYFDLY